MALDNPFHGLAFSEVLDTLLPDFVLAFTFFTALIYVVLGRRFGRQKPAAAMSIALGLALATGLIWWENDHGWSIRTERSRELSAVREACQVASNCAHPTPPFL